MRWFDPEGGPMMRRAGVPPDHMTGLISKSYCSAYCLEGQIFDRPGPGANPPTLRPSLIDRRTFAARQRGPLARGYRPQG
jgi:hypothetical protein